MRKINEVKSGGGDFASRISSLEKFNVMAKTFNSDNYNDDTAFEADFTASSAQVAVDPNKLL